MVKHSKGKSRLDKFYHLAREHGFRSRAAFKLIQLNKKYNFFAECRAVLDLCAAPGGWMQVAVKNLPVSSLVVGVDLIPIRPIRGAQSLVADITMDRCAKLIEKESRNQLFDLVLNDGSPNVGGAWHSESLSQAILVLDALKLATKFLAPDGWFITKVFRSKDYNALLYVCHQLFGKVEATKPTASRNASAEIFLVCQKYKAPQMIDPQLLDARHLLHDYTMSGKIRGPLAMQKKQSKKMHRKSREGYEEGMSTTFKSTSIMDFIKATDPVEALGLCTQFHFNQGEGINPIELETVLAHPKTSLTVKEACQDLLILGKKEFKQLLKWQQVVAKDLKKSEESEKSEVQVEELDGEERMMKEMDEIRQRLSHKAKKKEKKIREMKKSAKQRMAQFQQSEGITDQLADQELFRLDDVPPDIMDQGSGMEYDASFSGEEKEEEDVELDNEAMEEEYLEASYRRYLKRKGEEMLDEPELKRRLRLDGERSELEVLDDDPMEFDETQSEQNKAKDTSLSMQDITKQWFEQDVFQNLATQKETKSLSPLPRASRLLEDNIHQEVEHKRDNDHHDKQKGRNDDETDDHNIEQDIDHEEEEEEDHDNGDFEIVEQKKEKSETDTEDEFRLLDMDGKSEILAMARKMLHRKDKENLVDAAYSRFVFHDQNLPKWFEHDNDIYNRPQRMVTREEIEAEKELVRAMNSRPIKKVAEAKSRKTKRMAQRLRLAVKRAEGIVNQDEVSHGTKMKQITKVMNQARRKENSRFVTKDKFKKLGRIKKLRLQKKMPLLDRRLKSDKRQKGLGREAKNSKSIKARKVIFRQRYKQKHRAP